jgi:hypothetical protein
VESFKVQWTDTDGTVKRSVVSYDKGSAAERVAELKDQGLADAEAVKVLPGQ